MTQNTDSRTSHHSQFLCATKRGLASVRDGLKRFTRNVRGNISIVFGLSIIPVSIAAGAVIDYSRASSVQDRLGHAIDAAALAIGSSLETDSQVLEDIARTYFESNYPDLASEVGGNLNIIITDSTITISATADVATSIVKIIGVDVMPVSASTEVTKETTGTEVVLVLDNTGSMGWNEKITALKQASAELVEIAFGDDVAPQLLKFGLVPFSAAVNVGADKLNSGWIDTTGASSYHSLNFASSANVFDMYDQLQDKSWNGCIQARPSPYDTTDAAPTVTDGDSLWVPYFAPDEPDYWPADEAGYWYANSYVGDNEPAGNLDMAQRQEKTSKYTDETVGSGAGPHFNCQIAPITPLTNQKLAVLSAVDAMVATGSTVIPSGLAWGWRVLSPSAPFTEGAAYNDEQYKKVIVLLTDGMNDIGTSGQQALPNPNLSWYSGYGYVEQGRLGATEMAGAHAELDARTATLCQNIKDEGILIYTITFQLADGPIKDLMRNCASEPDNYFDSPDNDTLRQHFQAIGKELRNLRISG
jgi:Flp pilus assembly protein TadG